MGNSRDRAPGARRREEPDRRERGDSPARSPAADDLLALQRSAGNRAVSALLARSPDSAKPKDEKSAGARATLPGIGTIPLLSVSFAGGRAPTGPTTGRRGEDDKRQTPQEIFFASAVGEHSGMLVKASIDGKPMDVEVIMPGSKSTVRLKLKGAIVSHYSTSGEAEHATESWTLNFESIEHTVEGEPGD